MQHLSFDTTDRVSVIVSALTAVHIHAFSTTGAPCTAGSTSKPGKIAARCNAGIIAAEE
jgi:hypothetical protein